MLGWYVLGLENGFNFIHFFVGLEQLSRVSVMIQLMNLGLESFSSFVLKLLYYLFRGFYLQ